MTNEIDEFVARAQQGLVTCLPPGMKISQVAPVVAVPTICVVNKAKMPLGLDLDNLVAALQAYVDQFVGPAWGKACKFVVTPAIRPGAWGIVFSDNADQAGALGYHIDSNGYPVAHVFVKTTLDAGEKLSVTLSHEGAEMLIDPGCQLWAENGAGKMLAALEPCDAVEETSFQVNGFDMSNFVTPAYFEDFHKPKSQRFDQMGLVDRPFQILKGGYALEMKDGQISEVFGSKDKQRRFTKEDRRLHRSEFRRRKAAIRHYSAPNT